MRNDPFRPCEKGEELLGPEVPYLNAIGALMYLANCTHPYIVFFINLLARYSSVQTKDIGMVLRKYCATSKEQLIWVYFTKRNQSNMCLDMLM